MRVSAENCDRWNCQLEILRDVRVGNWQWNEKNKHDDHENKEYKDSSVQFSVINVAAWQCNEQLQNTQKHKETTKIKLVA